jgi:hypothetical protein
MDGASSSTQHKLNAFDILPDLLPPYPTPATLEPLIEPSSQLTTSQKQSLIQHSLSRACLFADLNLLSYLLRNPSCRLHVDLGVCDEDGLSLVSQTILGFGSESERDVEREECLRLLIAEGADCASGDAAGWTPLHHAVLMSPPTLISHLLTHGGSPLAKSKRGLTPLDVINAYEPIPGREDIRFLLEDAMREMGWRGTGLERKREFQRQERERKLAKANKRKARWRRIGRVLEIGEEWWQVPGYNSEDEDPESDDDIEDEFPTDGDFVRSYFLVIEVLAKRADV